MGDKGKSSALSTPNRNGCCIQSKPWGSLNLRSQGSGTSEWGQTQYLLIPSLTIRLTDPLGYSLFLRAPCWLPSVEMAADYVLRRVSLLAASCAGSTSSWISSQLAPLAPHSNLLKWALSCWATFPFPVPCPVTHALLCVLAFNPY